jgi:membrane protein DedA with SNARE-associated domain
MENSLHFMRVAQDVILVPGIHSIWPLFLVSFLNDVVGLFPFALVLAGQLLFLKGAFSIAVMAKLLVFVAVPVGVGSAFGSIPLYLLAYFGGKPLINKFHKYLHFSWQDVERVNAHFKGTWYDEIIFLFLRCTPVLPSFPMDIAAGILRMGFWPFFVLTTVGSVVRMMLTMLVVGMATHGLLQF